MVPQCASVGHYQVSIPETVNLSVLLSGGNEAVRSAEALWSHLTQVDDDGACCQKSKFHFSADQQVAASRQQRQRRRSKRSDF